MSDDGRKSLVHLWNIWSSSSGTAAPTRDELTTFRDDANAIAAQYAENARAQAEHSGHCWGDQPPGCYSCACSDDRPCNDHRGSSKWRNALLERQAVALEMLANDGKLG